MVSMMGKAGKFEPRIPFKYDGRVVYEWEQSMEEVLIYVTPPQGVTSAMIDVKVRAT